MNVWRNAGQWGVFLSADDCDKHSRRFECWLMQSFAQKNNPPIMERYQQFNIFFIITLNNYFSWLMIIFSSTVSYRILCFTWNEPVKYVDLVTNEFFLTGCVRVVIFCFDNETITCCLRRNFAWVNEISIKHLQFIFSAALIIEQK